MLYMEKNMHDFDEEYVPGVRKKHNPAKWISLGAAAAMAIGIAAACIVRAPEIYPYAEPTPAPTAAPTPTPTAIPTAEPTPNVGAIVPAASATPDAQYVATAIMVDGKCIGVLASREAAEEVLDEAVSGFELQINLPGSMDSYITNDVELIDATDNADAAAMETVTYEAMLALLTGEDTPIEVETTLSERHTEIVAHETATEKDDTLIKGTRVVSNYGTDGESRTVVTTKYINSVQQGKSQSETFEISKRVDALIREGTIKADSHAEPGKREGAKGPDIGELSDIAMNTTVEMDGLTVQSVYVAENGCATLSCAAGDAEVTVRLEPLKVNGEAFDPNTLSGKTIDVRAAVDMYDNAPQLHVFTAEGISIH